MPIPATWAAPLAVLQTRGVFRGQLIKLYIIAYLLYRFATEYIRPEPRLWLGLTIYQWAALAFVPFFAFPEAVRRIIYTTDEMDKRFVLVT